MIRFPFILILFASHSIFAAKSDDLKPNLYEECLGRYSREAVLSQAKRLKEKVVEDLTRLSAELGAKAAKAKDLQALDKIMYKAWDDIDQASLFETTLTADELNYILANMKPGWDFLVEGKLVEGGERDPKSYNKDIERYYLNELGRLRERTEFEFAKLKLNEMIQNKVLTQEMLQDKFVSIMEWELHSYNKMDLVFDVKELDKRYREYRIFSAKQVRTLFAASKIKWDPDKVLDVLEKGFPIETARWLLAPLSPEYKGVPTCCFNACTGCPNSRYLRKQYDRKFRR